MKTLEKMVRNLGCDIKMDIVSSDIRHAVVTATIELGNKSITELGEVTGEQQGLPVTTAWETAFNKAASKMLEEMGIQAPVQMQEMLTRSEKLPEPEPKAKPEPEIPVATSESDDPMEKVIPFGRFKGETIKKAMKEEGFLQYVKWMKDSNVHFDANDKQEIVDIIIQNVHE